MPFSPHKVGRLVGSKRAGVFAFRDLIYLGPGQAPGSVIVTAVRASLKQRLSLS